METKVEKKILFGRRRKLQERIRSENQIEKLFDLLLEGNIFPVVQSLQEAQSRHEKTLFNERQRIVKEGKGFVSRMPEREIRRANVSFVSEKEAELIRRHSEEEKRCADRPQHLNILQTANKREFEVKTNQIKSLSTFL